MIQETMMTPRSRKPVVSLSGSDLCHLTSAHPITTIDSDKRLIMEESEDSTRNSLSSTFRDYLISRSVLTASPVDLSFSSRYLLFFCGHPCRYLFWTSLIKNISRAPYFIALRNVFFTLYNIFGSE